MGTSGCLVWRGRKRKTKGIKNYLNSCCSNFKIYQNDQASLRKSQQRAAPKDQSLLSLDAICWRLQDHSYFLLQPDCTITRFLNPVELNFYSRNITIILPENYSLMRGIGRNHFSIFHSLLGLSWSVYDFYSYQLLFAPHVL